MMEPVLQALIPDFTALSLEDVEGTDPTQTGATRRQPSRFAWPTMLPLYFGPHSNNPAPQVLTPLAPREGFEPSRHAFRERRSAVELSRDGARGRS